MKIFARISTLFCFLLLSLGSQALPVVVVPEGATAVTETASDSEGQISVEDKLREALNDPSLSPKKRKKLEKRMKKIKRKMDKRKARLKKKSRGNDILSEPKFRFGALLILVALAAALLASLLSSGLISWLAGACGLVGLIFIIWSLAENL